MERAVIVKGRVMDSRHIELYESVGEIAGEVEVTLRPLAQEHAERPTDIDALEHIEDEWRAKHPDRLRFQGGYRSLPCRGTRELGRGRGMRWCSNYVVFWK
jgi:hypothetical protein